MANAKQGAQPESFMDALGDIHMAIANAKLSPDADMAFLNKVEMVIMGRIKHQDAQSQQPGGAQPPGPSAAGGGAPAAPGASPGGPPGAAPPQGVGPPPGGPTPHAAIPPPDMDDVRRTIAQTTGE